MPTVNNAYTMKYLNHTFPMEKSPFVAPSRTFRAGVEGWSNVEREPLHCPTCGENLIHILQICSEQNGVEEEIDNWDENYGYSGPFDNYLIVWEPSRATQVSKGDGSCYGYGCQDQDHFNKHGGLKVEPV